MLNDLFNFSAMPENNVFFFVMIFINLKLMIGSSARVRGWKHFFRI